MVCCLAPTDICIAAPSLPKAQEEQDLYCYTVSSKYDMEDAPMKYKTICLSARELHNNASSGYAIVRGKISKGPTPR